MIEYLFSRIIVALAAVAIAGLVISASLNSYCMTVRTLAEDIAHEFAELVSIASKLSCEHFRSEFVVSELPFSLVANLRIRQQSITVSIGDFRAVELFDFPVSLIEGNTTLEEIEIWSNMCGICVESERDIIGKTNQVTLSVIDLLH